MTDFVGVLETHAEGLGWIFSYGNKANLNLLASDSVSGRKYLLLDPISRNKAKTAQGGDGGVTFSGTFLLLVKSDLDNVYHDQKGQAQSEGRYEKNIKPLLTELESLEDLIDCSEYEITSWQILDAINALDVNLDGVIVTFTVKILWLKY